MDADAAVAAAAEDLRGEDLDSRAHTLVPARGGRRRLTVLLVLLVLLVVASVAGAVLAGWVTPPDTAALAGLAALPLTTLVGVPVGLVLLVLLLLVHRTQTGSPSVGAPEVRDAAADVAASPAPTTHDPAPKRRIAHRSARGLRKRARAAGSPRDEGDLVPSMDPRALLLYARSLEGTLNDQEDRLEQVRREAADRRQADRVQQEARIRATVEVMRQVHAQQPGVVALGRTEAAVARLGVEPGFGRPLLPGGPAGTLPVAFGLAPVTPPAAEPAPAAARPADADPSEETAPPEVGTIELTASGKPRVRPVPPPPMPTPARPGRLRRRGTKSTRTGGTSTC